jgi:glycosyl hydrolase family 123
MNKKITVALIFLAFIFCNQQANAQNQKLENFGDISSITKADQSKWQQLKKDFSFLPADVNTRITYNKYPAAAAATIVDLKGWKGEAVNTQLVVSAKKNISSLNVSISDLTSDNGNRIAGTQCKTGYVYYVMADNSRGICHKQENVTYAKIIVPDIIDFRSNSSYVKQYTNRPVWISVKIPGDAQPGIYKGKITASCDGNSSSLNVSLKVSANKMPSPANRKFFLELWQYPITEADFYKVKPWSEEHFKLMKPAMVKLKDAGEGVITASFFWDPFNPRIRDVNDMFIKVVKSKSGGYNYDFANFDKWVNYMMDIGVNKQITVFGMATLNYRMYYFDEDSNRVTYFQQGINGVQYRQFWSSYLKAFEAHLKQKNWFNITTLGFSEKELDVSIPLIKFIKSLNKDWKISYSGKYFPQIQNDVYDYSLISNQEIPDSVIAKRRSKGFVTSFYTSCWEKFPNTFVMSDPVDASWLGWNAAKRKMDGYLRWAYDYWSPKVLSDVAGNIASGDNFLIYPDGYSSIRFEMLKDGIEDYEKIYTMEKQGKNSRQFDSILSQFDFHKVNANVSRSTQIDKAREMLANK